MTEILVTGALGNIGSSVVHALGDERVTVAGRSVDRLRLEFGPSIHAVELDWPTRQAGAPGFTQSPVR